MEGVLLNSAQLARAAADIASDKKASDVLVLDIREVTTIADYFVLTQEMREHNVRLLCVKEQYDDSPLGRCLQVIAKLAGRTV